MANSTSDDSRCERNDGRRWRCQSLRFGGNRHCEKHHLYFQTLSRARSKSRVRVSHPSSINKKKKSEPPNEKETIKVRVSDPLPEKKKRGRPPMAKKTEEIDTVRANKRPLGRPRKRLKLSEIMVKQGGEESVMVADPSVENKKKKCGRPLKAKPAQGKGRKKRGRVPKEKKMEGIDRVENKCSVRGEEEESCRVLELGQIWAFSNESDGFPQSYARIDRIIPTPSLVRVTPLIPHPVSREEKLFVERGLSLACGLFKASDSTVRKEISAFTHNVLFKIEGKGSSFFKIFPRKGEIWAVYLKWDDLKKSFDYELVEVESDFEEKDGLKVFGLARVEGMDRAYRRQEHEGFQLVRSFSRGFMSMFSHRVPASRIWEGGEMLWKVMLH